MALEDFTTYTEDDDNSRYVVTANKIAVTLVNRSDNNQHVWDDKGVDYFDGDFVHSVKITVTFAAGGILSCWCLGNVIDGLIPAASNLWVDWYNNAIRLVEQYSDSFATDTSITLTLGDPYYLTIERDESVGTYGTLYCYIYDDEAQTSLVDTLVVTLHTKADWRYVFGTVGFESGTGTISGDIENLNLDAGIGVAGYINLPLLGVG